MTFNHPWRGDYFTNTADENSLMNYLTKHLRATLDELSAVFDSSPDIIQRRMAYLERQEKVTYSPSTKTWYLK